MVSTMEFLALAVVGVVLIIAVVQAAQLAGLNDKITTQNTAMVATGGQSLAGTTAPASPAPQPASSGSAMVGGC